jgi:hypothetical protein
VRHGDLVSKNREAEKGVLAQLLGNMQSVLAQSALAGWKGGYQTNLHNFSGVIASFSSTFDEFAGEDVG